MESSSNTKGKRNMKTHRKLKIALIAALGIAVLLVGVCAAYVGSYYHASEAAAAAMAVEGSVTVREEVPGRIVFAPANPAAGLVFYPGGKVGYTAYAPLMRELAERGVLCVLLEMPFNLAVLDVNAAGGVPEDYPQTDSWYIGGHSLGGAMAATYFSENADTYDGLILLGAYSTADLSGLDTTVISIYGSEDGVMDREKYLENRAHLPAGFEELVIEGGCHAYFADYGAQAGDGTPTISREEQLRQTADRIAGSIAASAAAR